VRIVISRTGSSRRTLLIGAGAGLLARNRAVAQAPRPRVTVIMGIGPGAEGEGRLRAFRAALDASGWHTDDRLILDVVWAEGDPDRVQQLTRRVLAQQPDVVVATATPIAVALRDQAVTRPVVFVNLVDPVGAGLIGSFAAPGTNFTGLTNTEPALAEKWLELLKDVAPQVSRVGFLYHPTGSPFGAFRRSLEASAPPLALTLFDLPVSDPTDVDAAVARCAGHGATGLVVMTDLFTSTHHRPIVEAATRYAVPSVYPYRFFVSAGGLLSYSADLPDLYGRAAQYVDRVLRGAKPSDLPVQTPSKYNLVINLRTASSLGLQIPAAISARADEFIE
jgi:putative tryptophan/tyrosine transport system substrate-binding protein